MRTNRTPIPGIVGSILIILGVGVLGSRTFQDAIPVDWDWLIRLTRPMQWKFLPEGMDSDFYIARNLVPFVFTVAACLLVFAVTRDVARSGFGQIFFSIFGAIVGAGVLSGVCSGLYNELIVDDAFFYAAYGSGIVNHVTVAVTTVVGGPVVGGLIVAFVVAVTTQVVSPGNPSASYVGDPLDPSPPMTGFPTTPLPPTPPPSTPPPSAPPSE